MSRSAFPRIDREALWVVRLRARLPRLAVLALALVLCAVGVRSLLSPPRASPPRLPSAPVTPIAAEGFAERFARVYLSAEDDRGGRARQLAALTSPDVELGTGTVAGGAGEVIWSAVVSVHRVRPRRVTVVVEAGSRDGVIDLAVPVAWDGGGRMVVPAAPALVGAPLTTTKAMAPVERDVEDAQLQAVCERVVRNYLAGDGQDLQADLAPGARVSLPGLGLRLQRVNEVTWASASRVALNVDAARTAGESVALRYELAVLRTAGRWLVTSVVVNPTVGGSGGDG